MRSPYRLKSQVVVTHGSDDAGVALSFVALARGEVVTLLRETYDLIVLAGFSTTWCAGGVAPYRYVYVPNGQASGSVITVARIIARATAGQRVRYLDGDRLNLRDDNLYLAKGFAKRTDGTIPNLTGTPGLFKPKPKKVRKVAPGVVGAMPA